MSIPTTAETFDSLGKKYEIAFAANPAHLRSLDWLLSLLRPHSRIIDLGSGTGRPTASTLVAAGHDVIGVDVSPVMVDLARQQVPNAEFQLGDARSWEPPSQGYDAVVAYFSLISGVTRAEISETFSRANRWLRPGGYFIFASVAGLEAENLSVKWLGRDVLVSGLSREEVLAGIGMAGFEVVNEQTEAYLPKGVEAGACEKDDIWEESQLFVYAQKPGN